MAVGDDPRTVERGIVQVVDPVSGRAYPAPVQRSPRPVTREAFERDAPFPRDGGYERDLQAREAYGRETHAPRHLADSWEGPVNLNRPLPSRRHGLQWLLALPIIPPLLVPLYNRLEPRLLGLPFFYWFQLASVVFAIAVIGLVYQLTKGRRPRWPR
jgi:hypothetical protein